MTAEFIIVLLTRVSLVALFLPFSVLYIALNFSAAVAHAATLKISQLAAKLMIFVHF